MQPHAGKPKPRGPSQPTSHPQLAKVLVIAAHPQIEHSRATRGLMRAAAQLDPSRVQVCDVPADARPTLDANADSSADELKDSA